MWVPCVAVVHSLKARKVVCSRKGEIGRGHLFVCLFVYLFASRARLE